MRDNMIILDISDSDQIGQKKENEQNSVSVFCDNNERTKEMIFFFLKRMLGSMI